MVTITSDDILGKTAVDPHGLLLGVVVKLHIDKQKKQMLGITVDQGFMKPDLYVGIDNVKQFGVDAILLSNMPYHLLKGKKVFNASSEHVGIVSKVLVEESVLRGLVIKKKTGTFKKSAETTVPASAVKETGQTIILRRNALKNA